MGSENIEKMMKTVDFSKPSFYNVRAYFFRNFAPSVSYKKLYPGTYLSGLSRYNQAIFWGTFFVCLYFVKKNTTGFTKEKKSLDDRQYYTLPQRYTNIIFRGMAVREMRKNNDKDNTFVF